MSGVNRYLCFGLGKEEFAIPLLRVKEVLGFPEVTPIPQSPPHFLGIMNLRGSVISILDLRIKIGFKPERTEETAAIILDLENFNLGMVVDRVNSVVALADSEIDPKPVIENAKATDYMTGVFRKDNKLVIVLDLEKTLAIEDQVALLKNSGKKAA